MIPFSYLCVITITLVIYYIELLNIRYLQKDKIMDKNYIVGDLIYEASIYDGLNTFLDDLEFYKKWLPKNKEAKILELCCGTGRLTIPIAKEGYNII